MTKRVLVAVDGTDASNTALEIACALADSYDANLGLLCVVEPQELSDSAINAAVHEGVLRAPDFGSWQRSAFATTGYQDAQRGAYAVQVANAVAESTVSKAKAYAQDTTDKAVKTFIRSGDVANAIVDVADTNDADLIVMGHDQKGVIESLISGSVAEKVARQASCPCLVFGLPKK